MDDRVSMTDCLVCQQTQQRRLLIEGDLRAGLATTVIAMRYHLAMNAIAVHERRCMTQVRDTAAAQPSDGGGSPDEANGGSWQAFAVTDNPLSQWKQAWALAKDDPRLQAQMVHWLNEQIQSEDMGLP